MKKLIATIMTVVLLLASSIIVFAEVSEVEVNPTATPNQKFEKCLRTRAGEMEKLQEKFNELKVKIEEKRVQIKEKKAGLATEKEEFREFKAALFALRGGIIDLMKEGNSIRSENASLRADLANSLNTMRDNGIEIPEETQAALEAGMASIKELAEDIKGIKAEIKTVAKGNHEFRKNKDYAGLETAFESIKTSMENRNTLLTEINEILKDMVELLVTVPEA